MSAAIHGVGSSRFAKQPGRSAADLVAEAVGEALADAGSPARAIEAAYVGSCFGEPGIAPRTLHRLGIAGIPIFTVEAACASGTTAFHLACEAVAAGRFERVLALGVEHMTSRFEGAIVPEARDAEGASGMALPSLYAMSASRYLAAGWVSEEQLALVSVKNHRHALGNPRAQYGGELSVEEVLASRPIADPLTLLQCCPISDAAAAAVLGPPAGGPREVAVRSCATGSGRLWDQRTDRAWGFELVRDVAAEAFEAAGIGPGDADLFEVHDAFTIGEIVTTEALGLAAEGGGGELVQSGRTALGGAQPVNPSGGLLSRGHPLGATGMAQVAEVAWQLRGEAGPRQVEGARVGVVETMGGGASGIDGNAAVVAVLGG
ncbi:MAG TPA: thiolase family protein [Solirubrobacterales bacterium]